MRNLHEKYWKIASAQDVKERDERADNERKRWHPKKIGKTDEEIKLALKREDSILQSENAELSRQIEAIEGE